MAFQDEAKIIAISGKGGNGCLSFRRENTSPGAVQMAVTAVTAVMLLLYIIKT